MQKNYQLSGLKTKITTFLRHPVMLSNAVLGHANIPVRDWEDSGAEPINRDGHENIARDEVTKDPEEHHDLTGEPVSPP